MLLHLAECRLGLFGGPMGAFGVEPRIEMAADSTAHIVFDNMMDMTCM